MVRNNNGKDSLGFFLEQDYPITVYRAEEGGYVIEIEDLPGCITEGDTLDEAFQQIDEARQLWLQTAFENGINIPIPRTEEEYSGRFLVRIPKYLHRRLAEQAKREGTSLNSYVASILSSSSGTKENNQEILKEIKTYIERGEYIKAALPTSSRIYYHGVPIIYEIPEVETEGGKIIAREMIGA